MHTSHYSQCSRCGQWYGTCWMMWTKWALSPGITEGDFLPFILHCKTGFLPFRVNLIDSCFITIPLSDIQNAWLVVPLRFSHVLPPQRFTINCTLHIHQLEFAFISQEYLLNKMHTLLSAGMLSLALAENTGKIFIFITQCPLLSLHVNSPRSQKVCSMCYFDPIVFQ